MESTVLIGELEFPMEHIMRVYNLSETTIRNNFIVVDTYPEETDQEIFDKISLN